MTNSPLVTPAVRAPTFRVMDTTCDGWALATSLICCEAALRVPSLLPADRQTFRSYREGAGPQTDAVVSTDRVQLTDCLQTACLLSRSFSSFCNRDPMSPATPEASLQASLGPQLHCHLRLLLQLDCTHTPRFLCWKTTTTTQSSQLHMMAE